MSGIVDLRDRITDNQIDQNDRQYTSPDRPPEKGRNVVSMANPENQQNSEQSENRS